MFGASSACWNSLFEVSDRLTAAPSASTFPSPPLGGGVAHAIEYLQPLCADRGSDRDRYLQADLRAASGSVGLRSFAGRGRAAWFDAFRQAAVETIVTESSVCTIPSLRFFQDVNLLTRC